MNNKYLDWINYQISNCKQAIELAKAVLDGAPPETLWVCLQNQHFYFYAYSEEEKRRQFIKKKDKDVAIRLADKEYCENLISVAQTALYHLNGLRQFVDAGGLDAAFTSMHPAKQNLIAPLAYTDANKIRQWEAQAYVHMPQKADGELTQKGERVRSKSELIYANIFVWLGIPYRYEQTIILKNGKVYSPDFVLYDVFTGKEILIEHFGRMDDPEYAREAVIKINDYIEDGYVLGDTFSILLKRKITIIFGSRLSAGSNTDSESKMCQHLTRNGAVDEGYFKNMSLKISRKRIVFKFD